LIFSSATDQIWQQQAPVLQVVLREPEFSRMPVFQIDALNADVMKSFGVTAAGTLLIMKGGFERLRSSRMIKPDPIRKMLRLQGAL
jgi:hypothetical protein